MFVSQGLFAQKFQIGDIVYYINGANTVEVGYCIYNKPGRSTPPSSYSYVIPSTVEYQSHTYTVVSIRWGAFSGCEGLTSIILPNTITEIERGAFEGCSSLEEIVIPNCVTTIGEYCFAWCKSLKSLSLSDNLKVIPEGAFQNCVSLTSLTLTDNISGIGWNAFVNCSSLKELTISNGLRSIGDAFWNCDNLEKVNIPSIGAWCKISFYEGNGHPLRNANLYLNGQLLTNLIIPDNVEKLSNYAFYGCKSLKSVVIPNTVKTIGKNCFEGCANLETASITSTNVEKISAACFKNCPKFWKLCYYGISYINSSFADEAFTGTLYNTEGFLYVPKNMVNAFKTQSGWKNWKNILSFDDIDDMCEAPTIEFMDSSLRFYSSTPGAKYRYSIEDDDIISNQSSDGVVELKATYRITAYAVADGYKDSEKVTVSLFWINGETETDNIIQVQKRCVSVSSDNGCIKITGVNEGEQISLYNTKGSLLYTSRANNGIFQSPNIGSSGEIIIIKVANDSLKYMVK